MMDERVWERKTVCERKKKGDRQSVECSFVCAREWIVHVLIYELVSVHVRV
jgi:hypothetical protein